MSEIAIEVISHWPQFMWSINLMPFNITSLNIFSALELTVFFKYALISCVPVKFCKKTPLLKKMDLTYQRDVCHFFLLLKCVVAGDFNKHFQDTSKVTLSINQVGFQLRFYVMSRLLCIWTKNYTGEWNNCYFPILWRTLFRQ